MGECEMAEKARPKTAVRGHGTLAPNLSLVPGSILQLAQSVTSVILKKTGYTKTEQQSETCPVIGSHEEMRGGS